VLLKIFKKGQKCLSQGCETNIEINIDQITKDLVLKYKLKYVVLSNCLTYAYCIVEFVAENHIDLFRKILVGQFNSQFIRAKSARGTCE
jgi:hypothetical protein